MFHSLTISGIPDAIARHLLTFNAAIVVATWVSAILGAALTYLWLQPQDATPTPRGFLRFCFPSVILRHKSCRLDLLYLMSKWLVHPFVVAPVLVGNLVVAHLSYAGLTAMFGAQPQRPEGWAEYVLLVAVSILIADFFNFFCHFLEHKVKLLWELHKVHHSTLFLLPISNRRIHPIQEIFDAGSIMVGVGLWIGIASYVFHLPIQENLIVGIDAYFIANLLSFYHLRHSHIPMSYGWLERYVMSPAQHQLHHSVEVRHWDHNFGLLLSCWDRMAGTLLYSKAAGGFRLGLPAADQGQFQSLLNLYVSPLINIARRLTGTTKPSPASAAIEINRPEFGRSATGRTLQSGAT